ncbi:16548_t:CDS:2 [Cetraspora pellucida]|uniref:16548_t:CDS:1 n=1 Tax=Cetraspora pellucida TaxID=1433469 RepID=A0A9N9GK95_9GLOM|nr:16548_t:CDS:2 [Cetraspora pellucida]
MLQDKPRFGTLMKDKHVENETTKNKYVKIIYMKTKHVEGEAFKPLEDKFKEDKHVEVELVKDKSVKSGDIKVELVDIEGEVSEAVEGSITLESNSEINIPVFGLKLEGLDLNINQPIELSSRYSDIILHDNTLRTNKYNFSLSLFILINNDGKLWLAAQAFLSDETQKSYEWVLQQTLDATAKSFISRIFTAGMQSTLHVESINTIIHKAVDSSSSMSDVVEALELHIQRKKLNKSFIEWKHKSIKINKQICESVLYKCEKLDIDHALEGQLDSDENELINKITENIEDFYDYRQTCLKELLKSVSKEAIKEVWKVIPYMASNLYQHIVMLNDDGYMMMLEDILIQYMMSHLLAHYLCNIKVSSNRKQQASYDTADSDGETRHRCRLCIN